MTKTGSWQSLSGLWTFDPEELAAKEKPDSLVVAALRVLLDSDRHSFLDDCSLTLSLTSQCCRRSIVDMRRGTVDVRECRVSSKKRAAGRFG